MSPFGLFSCLRTMGSRLEGGRGGGVLGQSTEASCRRCGWVAASHRQKGALSGQEKKDEEYQSADDLTIQVDQMERCKFLNFACTVLEISRCPQKKRKN